jgi:hypothetical protein
MREEKSAPKTRSFSNLWLGIALVGSSIISSLVARGNDTAVSIIIGAILLLGVIIVARIVIKEQREARILQDEFDESEEETK